MENSFETLVNKHINDTVKIIGSISLEDNKKELIKTNWTEFIKLMELLAQKHLRRYNTLNLITIVAGILIPVTINVIPDANVAKLTGTLLGVLVSVSATINHSYRFYEKWRHYRSISEELKMEGENYLSLSEKYERYNDHDREAFKLFMANVEAIKARQINTFMRNVTGYKSRQNKRR
jgi:hypothetical protein